MRTIRRRSIVAITMLATTFVLAQPAFSRVGTLTIEGPGSGPSGLYVDHEMSQVFYINLETLQVFRIDLEAPNVNGTGGGPTGYPDGN